MRLYLLFVLSLGISQDVTAAIDTVELPIQIINTEIGETFNVDIPQGFYHRTSLCQVLTPNGTLYDFVPGEDVPGIQFRPISGYQSCQVSVTVLSEDLIGEWTLIGHERMELQWTEIIRKQPFRVYVERPVDALPLNTITIKENSDFHFRLKEPTDEFETCQLVPPNGENKTDVARIKKDNNFPDVCAYIIGKLTQEDNGEWEIVYGATIVYRATVEVKVEEVSTPETLDIDFLQYSEINEEVGPENAVYCRVENPRGIAVFDGFGRCVIRIDRMTEEDIGLWKLYVGLPGKVIATEYYLNVRIRVTEPRPKVEMSLAMTFSDLTVSCSVATKAQPRACKFRDPHGQLLVSQQGVGEGRYSFNGTGVREESGNYYMDCGLRIASPSVADLGIWRCGVETEEDTHFGFHLVVCPWLMMDEEVAATIETEPIVKSQADAERVTSGHSVMMSCTVASSIRYCYFMADNGTMFSLSPGVSHDNFEYIGSGFEAGECGIRLTATNTQDEGRWSCHVGMTNGSLPEQSDNILLFVTERMTASMQRLSDGSLMVMSEVYHAVDYCRFVRHDGFGFTNDLVPYGYHFTGDLSTGLCRIHVPTPGYRDLNHWTIATMITGQQVEHTIMTSAPQIGNSHSNLFVFRLTLICIGLVLLVFSIMGLMLGPKKNRRWTYTRAAAVRNSISRSFRKAPKLEANTTANSPQAA